MQYRLGLDVGTSSVGLVALELDEKGRAVKPVWHSVRIFDEPLLPAKQGGVGQLKKADRRLVRQQRRLHQRRARRLKHIAHLARRMDLDPETIDADKGQRIHELQVEAATFRINLDDLLRVLLKMGKRRGYSGGFRVKKDDDKGQVETGIHDLKDEMQQHDCETLGEYLRYRIENGRHLRLKDDGLFADRQMVEEEFNRIWETQEKYHPVLKEDYEGEPLREHFHKIIIQQRPLKSPAAMVGNCSLEPMLPRAPMAQPIMQAFRIEKQIADLRWGTDRHAPSLCPAQRAVIREQLRSKGEVKFTTLYKALDKAGCPDPDGRELNLTRGDRESLTGDKTAAAMKSLKLLEQWQELEEGHRISVINLLADMGSPDVFDSPRWAENLEGAKKKKRQIKPEVKAFIDTMVETEKFDRLTKMKFDGGRSNYSIKALKKLVPVMEKDGVDEREAISRAYPDSNPTAPTELEPELPPHKPTGNAVVDVALGQVGREVNAAIATLGGTPSEIVIELSRDMRTGLTKRDEITKKIRKNEKRRRDAADMIRKYTKKEATESQIKRYLLWQEQGERYCPYCEVPINCSDAINGGVTEYEHILPKSLTRIGKKRDFLVLAHKTCNQEKGDRTPWQRWQDTERWDIIEHRAEEFERGYKVTIDKKERTFKHKGKARQLLVKHFENEALDEEIIKDFSDRQFQETAWIAKACGRWLQSICPNVSVSRGLLTAHLRRIWKLDTVIPEVRYEEALPVFDDDYQPNKKEANQTECKISEQDFKKHRPYWEGHSDNPKARTHRRLNKRIDHRHHLVDALVIALTTRGLYQRMARHYQQVTESGGRELRLRAEPELADVRERALELVRACRPSHRPDRWLAGRMFKDNPYGIVEEDGSRFYVQRTAVADLATSRSGDAPIGAVRKKIEDILPESVREIVSREFEVRIDKGKTPKQALAEPIWHPLHKTCIRRIRLRYTKAGDAVRVQHGNRRTGLYKHLEPKGYAYLEFDRSDPDSNPRPVPLHEAKKSDKQRRSQSGVVRLYKKDTVRDSRDDKRCVVQQIKAEGPTLILSPITESVANVGNVQKPRSRKVGGAQIKRLVPIEDERPSDSAG